MSKFNKHIIIVGTARSGTSWLAEIMACQYRYRLLFEPEHETQTKKGNLLCDKWLISKQESVPAYAYLKSIFQNRVNSDWIAQSSNRKFKRHLWPFIPKMYIIKFVRANLLAKFMNEEFSIPVLHIIRNPYDVITSQQKVKFPWLYDLAHFSRQEKLVQLIQDTYNFDIRKTEHLSEIEILATRWCIENVIPIDCFQNYSNSVKLIRYEDLRSDINVFLDVCKTYHIDPVKHIEDYYQKPSSKTHFKSNTIIDNSEATTWSLEDVVKVNKILGTFKSSLYPQKN